MPSHHSHSSHSSHSHSSSHHSSSSHSSRSHSSSSHSSSSYYSTGNSSSNVADGWLYRPTKNQPKGYKANVRRFCGMKHNYTYYNEPWTYKGTEYKAGWYDENGDYYQDVAFTNRGDTILCNCPFCGSQSKITKDMAGTLACPNCGGGMEMISITDELICERSNEKKQNSAPKNLALTMSVFIIAVTVFTILTGMFTAIFNSATRTNSTYDAPSNTDIFGTELYLDQISFHVYEITTDKSEADKILKWDYGADSYYDEEADCYLWYNTDVAPNLWQYWYEGISSQYPDYGWMEHESGGWYIETSSSHWEPLNSWLAQLYYINE